MNDNDKDLYKIVDKILQSNWDPIGVNDVAPEDEYLDYVPEICKMLMDNKTNTEIAERLNDIAINTMGLFGNIEHYKQKAKKLIDNK